MVGASLLFDVSGYCLLASMFAYGTGEIAVRPELPSPESLLDLGAASEYLSCSEALDRGYYFGHAVGRNGLHQKMHVILVSPDLQKLHLVPVLYLYAYAFHHHIHVLIKHCPSVLGRENQVVYED